MVLVTVRFKVASLAPWSKEVCADTTVGCVIDELASDRKLNPKYVVLKRKDGHRLPLCAKIGEIAEEHCQECDGDSMLALRGGILKRPCCQPRRSCDNKTGAGPWNFVPAPRYRPVPFDPCPPRGVYNQGKAPKQLEPPCDLPAVLAGQPCSTCGPRTLIRGLCNGPCTQCGPSTKGSILLMN